MFLRRSLAELEDFRIAHIGDQVLRLFTEWIDLLSVVEVLQQQVPDRVILELLTQSFDCFFAICVLFSERLSEAYLEFCNQRYRDKFPCSDIADSLRDVHDLCPRDVSDRFPCTARSVRCDGRWIFSLRD